ncbi:hypothetical protein NKG94_49580 [Micromonospora sp. M12]
MASDRLAQRSGPSGGASRARSRTGCGSRASGLGPVLTRTSERTRSGRRSASAVAMYPPLECPIVTTDRTPRLSSTAATRSAWSGTS